MRDHSGLDRKRRFVARPSRNSAGSIRSCGPIGWDGSVLTGPGVVSGPDGGEVVAVELGEVVGGHQ